MIFDNPIRIRPYIFRTFRMLYKKCEVDFGFGKASLKSTAMKKLITLFLSLVLVYNAGAQTVIFKQDFDKIPGYYISGWGHSYSGVVPWQAGLLYQVGGQCFGGPQFAHIAGISDCGPNNPFNNDVLMYSPAIDLTNISGAWLKYDSYFDKKSNGSLTENATVEISTDSTKTWIILETLAKDTAFGQTHYVDLSAYSNSGKVFIGFRYSDRGAYMHGWAIDNVQVFIPASKDIALRTFNPEDSAHSYATLNTGIVHSGTVFNAGKDTIHSFIIQYQQDGQSLKSDTISGISLPMFGTLNFVHKIPDTVVKVGTTKVSAHAELDGDTIHNNDRLEIYVRGAYFMPRKKLAIEEGTGTWNPWAPRGMVYLKQVEHDDADPCLISAHSGDSMSIEPYGDFLYDLKYAFVPFFLFDRKVNVDADSFFVFYERMKNAFGYADINVDGGIYYENTLTITTKVKPAIDMTGDYRPVLVLTEDDVTGTGAAYDQQNNFAGGKYGPMGGFESKPSPVPASDMHYNWVARSVTTPYDGVKGAFPSAMYHNTDYTYIFTLKLDPKWHNEKLRAIVMLVNYNDSTVVNSNKKMFYLGVPKTQLAFEDAVLYPNPSYNSSKIYFSMNEPKTVQVTICDISGRVLSSRALEPFAAGRNEIEINTAGMPNGIYLVNLQSGTGKKTLKLEVMH